MTAYSNLFGYPDGPLPAALTLLRGSLSIAGGAVTGVDAEPSGIARVNDGRVGATPDHRVTVLVASMQTTGYRFVGCLARMPASGTALTGYMAEYNYGEGRMYLAKWVNGVYSLVKTADIGNGSTSFVIALDVRGNGSSQRQDVYVNNALVLSATDQDPALATGTAGAVEMYYGNGTSITEYAIDDIVTLPKAASLVDAFPSLDTSKWKFSPSPAAITATGTLNVPAQPNMSTHYPWAESVAQYDLTESSVAVEVVDWLRGSASETILRFTVSSTDQYRLFVADGATPRLYCRRYAAAGQDQTYVNYDPVAHRHWRLRHSGTQVHYETSPDRKTWTTLRSVTPAAQPVSGVIGLGAGSWSSTVQATERAQFDHLNFMPVDTLVHEFDGPDSTTGVGPATTGQQAVMTSGTGFGRLGGTAYQVDGQDARFVSWDLASVRLYAEAVALNGPATSLPKRYPAVCVRFDPVTREHYRIEGNPSGVVDLLRVKGSVQSRIGGTTAVAYKGGDRLGIDVDEVVDAGVVKTRVRGYVNDALVAEVFDTSNPITTGSHVGLRAGVSGHNGVATYVQFDSMRGRVLTEGGIAPPTATAGVADGESTTTDVLDAVSLVGSGVDPGNTALAYTWRKVSSLAGALSSTSAQNPTYTPHAPGEHVLGLVVMNASGMESEEVTVTLTALPGHEVVIRRLGQSVVGRRFLRRNGVNEQDALSIPGEPDPTDPPPPPPPTSESLALAQSNTAEHPLSTAEYLSLTVPLDTPATAGRRLVATLVGDKSLGTLSADGWQITVRTSGTSVTTAVATKVADGSETGIDWTWTTMSKCASGYIAEANGPADVVGPVGADSANIAVNVLTAGPLPAGAAGIAIGVLGVDSWGATWASAPIAAPWTFTRLGTAAPSSGEPVQVIAERSRAEGESVSAAFDWTGHQSDQAAALLFALVPPGSAATPVTAERVIVDEDYTVMADRTGYISSTGNDDPSNPWHLESSRSSLSVVGGRLVKTGPETYHRFWTKERMGGVGKKVRVDMVVATDVLTSTSGSEPGLKISPYYPNPNHPTPDDPTSTYDHDNGYPTFSLQAFTGQGLDGRLEVSNQVWGTGYRFSWENGVPAKQPGYVDNTEMHIVTTFEWFAVDHVRTRVWQNGGIGDPIYEWDDTAFPLGGDYKGFLRIRTDDAAWSAKRIRIAESDLTPASTYDPTAQWGYTGTSPWGFTNVQGNGPTIVDTGDVHFPKAARFLLDDTTRASWEEAAGANMRRNELSNGDVASIGDPAPGTVQWWAGTTWFPTDLVAPTDNTTTGGWLFWKQWHSVDPSKAKPLVFNVKPGNSPPRLSIDTQTTDFDLGAVPTDRQETVAGAVRNRVDWVMRVLWHNDGTQGRLSAWVNGVQKVTDQPCQTLVTGEDVYVKEGGYGNRWTTGTTPEPAVTLIHTGLRYGPTQASVTLPAPAPTVEYARRLSVNSGIITPGWELAVRPLQTGESGGAESITTMSDHIVCEAGGFAAGSHYARGLRNLPARDNHYIDCATPAGRFLMRAGFVLPADYYAQSEGFVRWVNIDNYPSVMRDTGETVGATPNAAAGGRIDEWRVGFGIVSATTKYPVLMSYHEQHEDMNLWQGASQLATGRHDVEVDFTPNTPGLLDGAWKVTIDGVVVAQASGVQTVPASVTAAERKVTTIFAGIDGAYAQDTKRLRVDLYSAEIVDVT